MTIQFLWRKNVYCLDFGRKTPWFEQVWLFSVTKLYYDKLEVCYADLLFTFGRMKLENVK